MRSSRAEGIESVQRVNAVNELRVIRTKSLYGKISYTLPELRDKRSLQVARGWSWLRNIKDCLSSMIQYSQTDCQEFPLIWKLHVYYVLLNVFVAVKGFYFFQPFKNFNTILCESCLSPITLKLESQFVGPMYPGP